MSINEHESITKEGNQQYSRVRDDGNTDHEIRNKLFHGCISSILACARFNGCTCKIMREEPMFENIDVSRYRSLRDKPLPEHKHSA